MAAENEATTRRGRIDPKLMSSGWSVVAASPARPLDAALAIEDYETDLGPADYVLADRGQLLGVVEAKKLTVGAQGVLPQAERYAKAIPSAEPHQGEFGVPFLYSTNGEEIWFHDVRRALNRSRRVSAFHTVKAMREMLDRDTERELAALRANVEALRILGKQPGILGDIFAGAQNRFTNPVNLGKLIGLIDETEWISIDTDVKAAAFEGLLEKAASEGKKGAGQDFTPRLLIQSMVRCVKPDPRASKDFAIDDPACGTGGFLIAAYEWLKEETGGAFDRDAAKKIR